jgi:hypothetical protein
MFVYPVPSTAQLLIAVAYGIGLKIPMVHHQQKSGFPFKTSSDCRT